MFSLVNSSKLCLIRPGNIDMAYHIAFSCNTIIDTLLRISVFLLKHAGTQNRFKLTQQSHYFITAHGLNFRKHNCILPLNMLTTELFCSLEVLPFATLWLFYSQCVQQRGTKFRLYTLFIYCPIPVHLKFCEADTTMQSITAEWLYCSAID